MMIVRSGRTYWMYGGENKRFAIFKEIVLYLANVAFQTRRF